MRDPSKAVEALRALLRDYDLISRLTIDGVYAQFSPTLDDYYHEVLVLDFTGPTSRSDPRRGGDSIGGQPGSAAPGGVPTAGVVSTPEIRLTRTVPGHLPRTMRAPGAPFPLGRAQGLFQQALAAAAGDEAQRMADAFRRGELWCAPYHVPRTQRVELLAQPAGVEALALLSRLTG